jgi:hypothetical protein
MVQHSKWKYYEARISGRVVALCNHRLTCDTILKGSRAGCMGHAHSSMHIDVPKTPINSRVVISSTHRMFPLLLCDLHVARSGYHRIGEQV